METKQPRQQPIIIQKQRNQMHHEKRILAILQTQRIKKTSKRVLKGISKPSRAALSNLTEVVLKNNLLNLSVNKVWSKYCGMDGVVNYHFTKR